MTNFRGNDLLQLRVRKIYLQNICLNGIIYTSLENISRKSGSQDKAVAILGERCKQARSKETYRSLCSLGSGYKVPPNRHLYPTNLPPWTILSDSVLVWKRTRRPYATHEIVLSRGVLCLNKPKTLMHSLIGSSN